MGGALRRRFHRTMLCDRSKFGHCSFARFAALEEIGTIVTDRIEPREREALEEHGIEVVVAD